MKPWLFYLLIYLGIGVTFIFGFIMGVIFEQKMNEPTDMRG